MTSHWEAEALNRKALFRRYTSCARFGLWGILTKFSSSFLRLKGVTLTATNWPFQQPVRQNTTKLGSYDMSRKRSNPLAFGTEVQNIRRSWSGAVWNFCSHCWNKRFERRSLINY